MRDSRDDPQAVPDASGLIRHCHEARAPIQITPEGGYRVPSNAFSLKINKAEDHLSVDIEYLMVKSGVKSDHYIPKSGYWAARVMALAVRHLDLGVNHVPVLANPHHGGIWGLEKLQNGPREKMQKKIAKLSAVLILPKK